MPDVTNPAAPPGQAAAPAAQPGPASQAAPPPEGHSDPLHNVADLKRAIAAREKLAAENEALRAELAALKTAKEQPKETGAPDLAKEVERIKQQLADASAQATRTKLLEEIGREYTAVGGDAGYVRHLGKHLDDVIDLLKVEGGRVEGVQEAIAALRKSGVPFGPPRSSPGGGRAPGGPSPEIDFDNLKPGDIARMTHDQFRAYQARKYGGANGSGHFGL